MTPELNTDNGYQKEEEEHQAVK